MALTLGSLSRRKFEHNVQFPVGFAQRYDLAEEFDRVLAGVTCGGFAVDLAGFGVQGGVERERAVAFVLEATAFGTTGRQRQDSIAAVESLNGSLLIDAEDRGMARITATTIQRVARY